MCGKWGEGDECGGGECGKEFFHGGVVVVGFCLLGSSLVGWRGVGQIGVFSGVRVQYDKGILRALWKGRRNL